MAPVILRTIIDLATLPYPDVPLGVVADLVDMGLIRQGGHGWQLTQCGEAFFEKLKRVPLFPLGE